MSKRKSLLVQNMRAESREMETFPVLIGDEVAYFHSVNGHYDSTHKRDVVELIHRVQGHGSPNRINTDELSHNVEVHLANDFYNLDVSSFDLTDEYPDKDYCLELRVESHERGPYSFSEALSANVDKRETRYE